MIHTLLEALLIECVRLQCLSLVQLNKELVIY